MACKPPSMAQRKRPGTSGGNSMAAPGPASCPTTHATESCDLKAVAARQRPHRYPKESREPKPLPHSCKAQYSSPKSQGTGRSHPEADADQEEEVKRYSNHEPDAELQDQRPATPSTPEHNHDRDDPNQGDFHGGADSLDDDSSSDYINNTSDDDDYDDGLAEEDEGVTYYIRYCPEDDSYLEGMDCNNQGDCNHSHSRGDCTSTMQLGGSHTDECQEAVEGWTEEGEGHAHTRRADREEEEAESEDYCPNEDEEEEGEEEERNGRAYTGDYYAPEDNGNSVRVSPYRSRKVLVVEGETGEEAEEDIDQIVAEIKMSMSMGSLSSGTDQSPEELAQDPAPSDYPHSKPDAAPYPPPHHRHDSRPKSLNLPSMHHNNPDLQRGHKTHPRSPDDRQRWPQEQVSNGAEQPRKQQRSDLNVPLENNNVPEPTKKVASFPSFVDVPGPCEPEDLIDGIIFAANYLGSTQLLSERNPSKNIRMMQAQEAVSRVKRVQKAAKIKKKASADGDAQTLTEVDLFISTQRIKVLNADSQETMMDNALRTISYIADIGNIVVLMARRRMPRTASQDCIETTPGAPEAKKQYKMICHVFESEDAQLIAQSIGQAFSVAYQEFLRANGINPEDLSQKEYSDIINTQEMYNDDLIHFSNSENCKELQLEKSKGEILGVVIVESGWGSILPTVILANMMNGGPAARSGKLSIGDQIMSINNTSLVGLPLATCQGIIKGLKNQVQVKMNIVSCPPVTTVLIKRPDLKYQLGFSVQNGIICSLMRGGIAERGGVRVGHRIIEINGQSVVATAHEKIVQALSNSVGEIHMKTMPAAMFRLLTGQETPMYI
ncbi:amyloid beta A4 precursor protein-binding family A member 2 [Pundamilia nyererei]|uniref:Amyloid beta A4 precursor protein-binding family A member 2 n=1 Tax=Pundamilia nyererei TaxID=303518 RepID=A0A9Y6J8U5_9CICH|nr:PREDICTED: amyloid beta A4 precursor protein-binding family A member 2 [Pundamilia nyererei]